MITFKPTRNIDLIEAVGNHPDVVAGSNNGAKFWWNQKKEYYEVAVHGEFAGIVYCEEVQPNSYDCHAMLLKTLRGFSVDIGKLFLKYLCDNTNMMCVTSYASNKFRYGQMYCALIGLKRVGVIRKYFCGVDDVVIYSSTKEEILGFLNDGKSINSRNSKVNS
ncbi:DUF2824 family protein [Salmonella enterica]|nr:DUF2824 family protein [Salmonella enterica]EDC3737193.1 DUF2824 family protein [Salmonella enterica]